LKSENILLFLSSGRGRRKRMILILMLRKMTVLLGP